MSPSIPLQTAGR